MGYFVVLNKAAKMPPGCSGNYRRIAVIEVDKPDFIPAMISKRAKGVVRIVKEWNGVFQGKTHNCAAVRAMGEAIDLCLKLRKEGNENAA